MAIYQLQIKAVTRGTGRTATSAAAYRAGERIRDERTGALYDHRKRTDVLHKEIFLPSRLEGSVPEMGWARDRSTLWNSAEKAEQRRDSRVAREFQVSLPQELSAEQRVALARTFSREVADRYNVAVDLAIHAPRPEGDPRNYHAHLLATTREVTPDGLGPKTGLDRTGGIRSELGLPTMRQEFTNLRAQWAELANAALREAKVEARIDHRSLEAQGIDREPRPRLPW
ncbi:MAG: MobQ family relaxase, partial [Steroidobacteraceae bacterium]